jgi:hypothetical protein
MRAFDWIPDLGSIARNVRRLADGARLPDLRVVRELRKPRKERDVRALLLAGAAGAALGFLLDPQNGRRRRKEARDRLLALFRRGGRRAGRYGRRVSSDAHGFKERVTHRAASEGVELDDGTLANKVRSEVFREAGLRGDHVNVNVEHGTVVLRGEVASADRVAELEEETRKVAGVRGVENLLHVAENRAG